MHSTAKNRKPKQTKLSKEYSTMLNRALKEPGVKEAMKVYGQYEELILETQHYLGIIQPKESFSLSTSTS